MIIDSLTCFGIWPRRNIDISAATLINLMRINKVDKACTLSTGGIFYDFVKGNDETISLCGENENLIPIATVNPAAYLGVYSEIDRCIYNGFKLFCFFPSIQEWSISGLVFKKILSKLSCCNAGLIIPASEGISNIVNVAGGMKNPVIISSFRYSSLGEIIEAVKQYSNIYIETHMINSPDFLEILKQENALEKVVFGSNAPLTYMASALKQILNSKISDDEKEMVLSRNIIKIVEGKV